MKERIRRHMALFLALLIAATSSFNSGLNVYAASPAANMLMWNASVKDHGVVSEFGTNYTGGILYCMIDGNAAYCMNFSLSATAGQLMSSDSKPHTTLSDKQEKLLAYCMYYGHSNTVEKEPSNTKKNEYIATQAMVWIITEGVYGTGKSDSAAKKICKCAPDEDAAYKYYEKLKKNIDLANAGTIPSFASKTKGDADAVVLKWSDENGRYEHTFTDKNGVLADFDFELGDDYGVTKKGNSMTVYTKKSNDKAVTGTFTSNAGVVEVTTSCVFWLTDIDGYQEFVSEKPSADPVKAYIKVVTEDKGYGELTKTDVSTGTKLAGAVYGIYSDSKCTEKVDSMTTDKNGYAKSKALNSGTYYVKEISAPSGYVLSDKVYKLVVKAGQTTGIEAADTEQTGSITIYKEGEVLTGWNGKNFTYEKRKLQGAEFKVSAGADIYRADGTKVYSKGDVVKSGLVTGSDGKAVLSQLHLGKYDITETKSIDGYTLNKKVETVTLSYGGQNVTVQNESATILNSRQKAEVSVTKKDSATSNPLQGGTYTLYAGNDIYGYDGKKIMNKDAVIESAVSGNDGKASYSADLPISNSYYVKETKAPSGYTINSNEKYSFSFVSVSQDKASVSFTHTFSNDRVSAKIIIKKVDKETQKPVPQGDGTLEGAVYGLYARENIVHPDGKTGIIYKAGDRVATMTTGSDGTAEVKGLYLGNYYVKEITPPTGYVLDTKDYDVICTADGDKATEILKTVISEEDSIKQPFEIIKVSDNGDDTEAVLLEGAGFTAYLKSKLDKREDGSYDFDSAVPAVIGENGATTIFTDKNGYAKSVPIPYGTYVVVETVTPHNMETIKPFEVTITENKPTEPQVWRVFIDREFKSKLKIIKKDSVTGKPILVPNAEFKVYDMDKQEYVKMITYYPSKKIHTSFFTDEDGDMILPEPLKAGRYRIEELKAPYGYVLNDNHVEVLIDSDTFHEVDTDTYEAVITVEYEDDAVYGELLIEKKGEVLSGYDETTDFVYYESGLGGAEFEVYAAEDIYTPDMQTDNYGGRIKYYSEGDLVAALVTDVSGKASLSGLPLGMYRVVEVKSPEGYVLNEDEQIVTMVYADDKTPVIYESLTFGNERQKVSMKIEKKDSVTGEPIHGAVFGIYAAEDIANAYGKVLISKDTLIEEAVSDEKGIVSFEKDYPFADYYAKEISAPAGYVSNDEVIYFETEYQGQDIPTAEYESEFYNVPTEIHFTKEDITSGAELSGATLSVIDKNGKIIDTWKSDAGEAHVINRLCVGEKYILREEFAPYGYLKATDVEFTIEDTGEIQSVVMKDEVPKGSIVINKDGSFLTGADLCKGMLYDLIFKYNRHALAGVTFYVYAAEDIMSPDGLDTVYYEADEHVATIVTNSLGVAGISGLPLGKYYLVETETVNGFVINDKRIEADLSYADQFTENVFAGLNVSNERQKVKISAVKKDSETGELLSGAVIGLYAKDDILNESGEVIVRAGKRIERAVTGTDGKAVFMSELPFGKYYLKEIKAPDGYVKADMVYDLDVSYQGSKVYVAEFEAEIKNKPVKVNISKTDITGEKELGGAKLSVIDSEGKTVDSWVSEAGKSHVIKKLPAGKYILREETAPFGYMTANDVMFTVNSSDEVQTVIMKDEFVKGKIIIKKINAATKKPIAGVEFEIRDSEGRVIEKVITDEHGVAQSKELPVCTYKKNGAFKGFIKYQVVETKAADGYVLDKTVHEVTLKYDDEATECVVRTLELKNYPKEPETDRHPLTGDRGSQTVMLLFAISGVFMAILLYGKKKFK